MLGQRMNVYGHRIADPAPWAKWARQLLAERTTIPVDTGNPQRGWESSQDKAARQVEESRQARLIA